MDRRTDGDTRLGARLKIISVIIYCTCTLCSGAKDYIQRLEQQFLDGVHIPLDEVSEKEVAPPPPKKTCPTGTVAVNKNFHSVLEVLHSYGEKRCVF